MSTWLMIFNRIARYLHFFEEWLVAMVHVSDCVTTLETTELLSSNSLEHIDFLYGHESVSYRMRIPVQLAKHISIPIYSATINELVDVTEYVRSLAGPFHNFFAQPLRVKDIIPTEYHQNFKCLEIITSELRIVEYLNLKSFIDFHHGIHWARYNAEARQRCLDKLSYLQLEHSLKLKIDSSE